MKNSKGIVSLSILFALSIIGVTAQARNDWTAVRSDLNALANAYGLSWQWNRQTPPPAISSQSNRLSDTELDQLIRRIENGGDALRSSLTDAFDQTRYDPTRSEGSMNDALGRFKNATNQLRNRFDTRQLVIGDVERLLGQATPIEGFMRNNPVTDRAQSEWSTLRVELGALASAYNVAPNWGNIPSQTGYNGTNRLTGTFRLDPSRSDNPRDKAKRATQNVPDYERQDVYDQILARLESPEMLTIERRGATVTIASSLAPQSTFEADGRERQEQLPNRRSTRVTATLSGEQLVVSSNGYREDDFNVTFDATENERSLRVRRQIYSDRLTQPVVVDSVYDRSAGVAQWSIYNDSRPVPTNKGSSSGDFIVEDGESVVAVLNTELTTKQAKPGDRFAMTVRQPNQYAGAVIEGEIASVDRGGRLSGRPQMSLNFETIRLDKGQTYKFAGIIQEIRTQNGETVHVDNEGAVKENDSQTARTIERASIGIGVGTIIGASAGGGKGAGIGGVIGAAGGTGSVYVQGKDDVELPSGTDVTIRASAPR